jgi:hypothetical protein
MSWKTIRLELARAARFPQGSASRAYLLHLPVDENGLIEEEVFDRTPALATVRRHWPSERDRSGYVIRRGKDWLFSFGDRKDCDETAVQLPTQSLKPGSEVSVIESDGESHSYRVMGHAARLSAAAPALPIADAAAAR